MAVTNEFSSGNINSASDVNSWLGINPTTIPGLVLFVKADTGVYSDAGVTPANNAVPSKNGKTSPAVVAITYAKHRR